MPWPSAYTPSQVHAACAGRPRLKCALLSATREGRLIYSRPYPGGPSTPCRSSGGWGESRSPESHTLPPRRSTRTGQETPTASASAPPGPLAPVPVPPRSAPAPPPRPGPRASAAASRSWSQYSCILYLHLLFVQAVRLQPESQLHPLSAEATFHHDGLKRILVDVSYFFDATWTGWCYDGDVTWCSTLCGTMR